PARLIDDNFPTAGSPRGLVLLVEFADNELQPDHDNALFDRVMNEPGFSDYDATGSVADYFADQSAGLFTPQFDVVGPIKLRKTIQYYGKNDGFGNDQSAHLMVQEACQTAHDSLATDFSRYDYDNDGEVDFVYVIYAGYAESYGASDNTIWPHASQLSAYGSYLTLDGKQVDRYACSSELKYVSGTTLEGIGTFCHEFGHVIGLPDLYNTRGTTAQMGAWDVMDIGNYNNNSRTPAGYSAFERASLGWIELTELDRPADDVQLEGLIATRQAYRLSTQRAEEYFILENRRLTGWDAYLPGSGLMITHIDYEPSVWQTNGVNAGVHPRVDLVEADGTQGNGEATDLYPTATNNAFTDFTSPSSLSWDGVPTERGLTQIRVEDGVVHFRFMKDRLAQPQSLKVEELTDSAFTVVWDEVDEAVAYRLNLREVLPDSLNPVVAAEDFAAMKLGGYPKSDYEDIAGQLDQYLTQTGWTGRELYQSGGYVRVGSYGTDGQLTSPLLDCSRAEGRFTLALRLVSYPGKTVNYSVTALDAAGQTLESFSLKAGKKEEEVILHFGCGTAPVRLQIATQQERVFLNDLRIVLDTVAAPAVWTVGPKAWTLDSIAETRFTVAGLSPATTYGLTLLALADEELRNSLPTAPLMVCTPQAPTAIQAVGNRPAQVVAVTCYDLCGRPCTATHRGVVLRRTRLSDGTVQTEKLVNP
ncbi:MAG: M6 family metalloprotease domain-containing protein, partial [Alloprevotella sp.]